MAVILSEPQNSSPVGDRILGPGGVIASALPGYEPRRPQIEMANLCGEVIAAGAQAAALIEAGTGTGKSLAYLVPAILSGERVVVSTDTIQLQQQLVDKDLPFLQRVLADERPFTYAIAKGRANYFCERNTASYAQEYAASEPGNAGVARYLLKHFQDRQWDGDKATLQEQVSDAQWGLVCGDESCTGKHCEQATTCAYMLAKARYETADVVVTNHTLCLLHHYVMGRSHETVNILPAHRVWIGDEAHTLADRCQDVFGIEIRDSTPAALVKRLLRQAKALKFNLTVEGADGKRRPYDFRPIYQAADALFSVFHGAVKEQMLLTEFPLPVREQAYQHAETLFDELRPVQMLLHNAAEKLDPIEDKQKQAAIARLDDSIDALIYGLRLLLRMDREPLPAGEDEWVMYAEVTGGRRNLGGRDVVLHCKPVETAPHFRKIRDRLESAIFTSATLANGAGAGAFRAAANELGIDLAAARTLQVESPFDYRSQVLGYVPKGMPELRSPEYYPALAAEIVRILEYSLGRAFVLFTSNRDLRAVHELVLARTRFPLLVQGTAPKDLLIEEFKNTPNAVLFGVKTFWTGVDIPGDALSCVILVKLPFPQYEHPLVKARTARVEARGGHGFRDVMLPHCIREVKQGFGRLIRSVTDCGIFVILDPRMRTARYGNEIAAALPSFPCVAALEP